MVGNPGVIVFLSVEGHRLPNDRHGANGAGSDQTGVAEPELGASHSLKTRRFSEEATGEEGEKDIASTAACRNTHGLISNTGRNQGGLRITPKLSFFLCARAYVCARVRVWARMRVCRCRSLAHTRTRSLWSACLGRKYLVSCSQRILDWIRFCATIRSNDQPCRGSVTEKNGRGHPVRPLRRS